MKKTFKLAYDALIDLGAEDYEGFGDVLDALEEALAQPEQEPVAYCDIHHLPEPCVQCAKEHEGYNIPPQPKEPEQGPDVYIPADALRQLKGTSLLILRSVPLYGYRGDGLIPLYTTPPQRKPQFKEFIKWAGAQGYDCAQTCNSDTGEWIVLNPMTADLWKAWQAAHGIKE